MVMAAVPRSFDEVAEYQHKYSTDQVNIIESHSRQTGKLGMDILLDEWGTSGRVRPTVADLYLLCSSLELFRAADFLLEHLMGGQRPSRTFCLAVNGGAEAEVVGELQELYYNNRDVRLMLELLATSSGLAPAIAVLTIFDKVSR